MGTRASWDLQVVEHEGEAYLLLPRSSPSSYDIVRLKDQIGVGAVWLTQGTHLEPAFRHAAAHGVSPSEIQKIVVAGIRAGLFV
jgi:hypothetical protein